MGFNYNLIFINTAVHTISKELFFKKVKPKSEIKLAQIGFDEFYQETHLGNTQKWGFSELKDLLIIADEHYEVTEAVLSSFKPTNDILQLELGSTVDISILSYWKDGKMIRKLTEGQDGLIQEFESVKDQIPKDVYADLMKGNEDFGDAQWFEKNGTDHDNIIRNLLNKHNDIVKSIFELKWNLMEG